MNNEEVLPYVYKIIKKDTNEFYIGCRYANVKDGLKPENDILVKYFTSSKIRNIIKKNPDNFRVEILFRCGEGKVAYWYEQLLIKEQIKNKKCLNKHYIDIETSKNTFIGTGIVSEEQKLKISAALKGKKKKPFTKEHKDNIGKSGLGRKVSIETRVKIGKKMSIILKGNKHALGVKRTSEHIQKIKEMNIARTGNKAPTSECIYCHKIYANNMIARYHNEKCKHKRI